MNNKKKTRNNRRKGIKGELYYRKKFIELGYNKCITTRFGSREMDNYGIDLMNIPFNIQIKTGKHKGMKIKDVLKNIDDNIKETNLSNKPTILIHRLDVGSGFKRNKYDEIIHMTFKDFIKLIININKNDK